MFAGNIRNHVLLAIVGDKLLEQYKNRIINIHPSLIPSFCGPGFYGMHVHEAVFKEV